MRQASRCLDEAIGHIRRVGGEKTDAFQLVYLVDGLKQVGQGGRCLPRSGGGWCEVVAVRVYVLAQKCDLFYSAFSQASNLGDDLIHGTADLWPASQPDDTVGAQVIAPLADGHAGRNKREKGCPGSVMRVVCCLPAGKVQYGGDVGWLDKGVDPGIAVFQVRDRVDKAAHERQLGFRLAALETLKRGEAAKDLVLGALADDAGIEQDQIGVLGAIHLLVAQLREFFTGLPRISKVHLATDGPEIEIHLSSLCKTSRAATIPVAEAWTSPRVTPAPSPAAKRLVTSVSRSRVNSRREE